MIEKIEKQEWEKCQEFEKTWWSNHLKAIQSNIIKETPSEWTLFDNPFMHKYIMEISKDKIVIDIGCGPIIQHIIGRIECRLGIGVDPLLDEYKKSGWTVPVTDKCIPIISKSENLPFMNGYADIIVTINALDHMNDARASIQEMVRVLKPGGYLFINTDMRTPEQRQEGHFICIDNEFIGSIVADNKLQIIYQDIIHLERKGVLNTWMGIYKTA